MKPRLTVTAALAWLAALVLVVATATPALAQMAGAVGIPLPDSTLANATVSVRVVDGAAMGKVVGVSVRLLTDGQERETKTDGEGRAVFSGLRAGATAQAVIARPAGGDVSSQQFVVPAQGGTRLLLSQTPMTPTVPMTAPAASGAGSAPDAPNTADSAPNGAAGSAPFMGGGAMPDPRQMNGQARVMEGEPGGSLTLRVLQGSLTAPLANVAVGLVGYHADGTITWQETTTDAQGQAHFTNLNRTGHVAYYAFAALARGAIVDRVAGGPVILGPEFGARMILSGNKPDATLPAIDDVLWLASQPPPQPTAGAVTVTVRGDVVEAVALIDATSGREVARANVVPAGDETTKVTFNDVAANTVYYAQTTVADDGYRSAPFLMVPGRGAGVEVLATAPMRFRFHVVAAGIEDKQVGLQGEFSFYNLGWAPLQLGIDGFVLKTPVGARGNLLMEGEENSSIATPTGDGFALRRPLPPMVTSFQGGFSLPHEAGVMKLAWPLPYGAVDSSFLMVELGGATLEVPPGTRVTERVAQDGTKLKVINDIQIMPGQSMVLRMHGLPIAPIWRTWLPTAAGLVVLFMLIATGILAYRGAHAPVVDDAPSQRQARIAELYDQLAALPVATSQGEAHEAEPEAQHEAEREAMMTELAALLASAPTDGIQPAPPVTRARPAT